MLLGELAPAVGGNAGIPQPGAVDVNKGFDVDADVKRVVEVGEQGEEMDFIVGERVVQGNQQFLACLSQPTNNVWRSC